MRHRPKDGSSDDAPPTRMQAGDVLGVGPRRHRQFLESLMEAAAVRVKYLPLPDVSPPSSADSVLASHNQVRGPVSAPCNASWPSSDAFTLCGCHNQVWIDPDDPEEYLLSSEVCAAALAPLHPNFTAQRLHPNACIAAPPHPFSPAPLPLRPCRAQPPCCASAWRISCDCSLCCRSGCSISTTQTGAGASPTLGATSPLTRRHCASRLGRWVYTSALHLSCTSALRRLHRCSR